MARIILKSTEHSEVVMSVGGEFITHPHIWTVA